MIAKLPELSNGETITQNGSASFEIFKLGSGPLGRPWGSQEGVQKGSKKVGVYQLEGPAIGT